MMLSRQSSFSTSSFTQDEAIFHSFSGFQSRRGSLTSSNIAGVSYQGQSRPLSRRLSLTSASLDHINTIFSNTEASGRGRRLSIISESAEGLDTAASSLWVELFGPSPVPTPDAHNGCFEDDTNSPEYQRKYQELAVRLRTELLEIWSNREKAARHKSSVTRSRALCRAPSMSTTSFYFNVSPRETNEIFLSCYKEYDDDCRRLVEEEVLPEGSFQPYMRFWDIPWPIFASVRQWGPDYKCPITREARIQFLFDPERLVKRGMTEWDVKSEEQLMWSPINFEKRILNKVVPEDEAVTVCAHQLLLSYMWGFDDEVEQAMEEMNNAGTEWIRHGHAGPPMEYNDELDFA